MGNNCLKYQTWIISTSHGSLLFDKWTFLLRWNVFEYIGWKYKWSYIPNKVWLTIAIVVTSILFVVEHSPTRSIFATSVSTIDFAVIQVIMIKRLFSCLEFSVVVLVSVLFTSNRYSYSTVMNVRAGSSPSALCLGLALGVVRSATSLAITTLQNTDKSAENYLSNIFHFN